MTPRGKQWLWFFTLYGLGVLALAVVAYGLRLGLT